MTTQGRAVQQDTIRTGHTTAHRAGHTSPGRHRPPGLTHARRNPPTAITQRNLFPATHTSRSDQQRNHIHASRLDNLPLTMVPAGTLWPIAQGAAVGTRDAPRRF